MRRLATLAIAAAAMIWVRGIVLTTAQAQTPRSNAATAERPLLAEDVFKNITVLRGIPVNDFMATMGAFSTALGMSCQDCHSANDRDWASFAIDNPRKQTARRMVSMMNEINKTHFSGRQALTCFSCHRGADRPKVDYDLNVLYGEPPPNPNYVIVQAPNAPTASSILDKYVRALGGADRLSQLTSFTARGTAVGYGPESTERTVEIYARAPNQLTTIIHTDSGDSTTAIGGRTVWVAAPFRPVPVLALSGQDLDAAMFDAAVAFPGQLRQALANWRVGLPSTIDDRDVQVVQGETTAGAVVTLYFDDATGLLTRQMRHVRSPIGPLATEVTYSDYRVVAGINMAHRWTVRWLDGRENFTISEIRPNLPVDAARFGRPSAPVAPRNAPR